MARRILYVTFDGILQPIGFSQVARLLLELSKHGFEYTLLSLERRQDLARSDEVSAVRRRLEEANVAWVHLPFEQTGLRGVARNLSRVAAEAVRLTRRGRFDLVHARAYVPGGVGLLVETIRKLPFLFDARCFWIDERRDAGQWFTHPVLFRAGKRVERSLYTRCAAAVTLTEIAATDIRGGLFGPWADKPIIVVPTCVDYEEFKAPPDDIVVPDSIKERLVDKLVLGYIGSLNASYRVGDSLELFKMVRAHRDDAHLLCLTGQSELMEERLSAHGVERRDYTVATVPHREMPAWTPLVDWGLLLLNEPFAKRASVPTKLAEFFAAGVRQVQSGCNPEVSAWVRKAGSGHVLDAVTPSSLAEAASVIANNQIGTDTLEHAREVTRGHFNLRAGAEQYARLLSRLS